MNPIGVANLYNRLEPKLESVRALKLGDVLVADSGNPYVIAVSYAPGYCVLSSPWYGHRYASHCPVRNCNALTGEEASRLCGGSPGLFTFVGRGRDVVKIRGAAGGV